MTDELSPVARQIVERAREADQPTDANRKRVRAAVLAAVAAGAATSASSTAAAKGTASVSGGATAKLLLAVVVTAVAGGGYLALSGDSPPAHQPPPHGATQVTQSSPQPPPAPVATDEAPVAAVEAPVAPTAVEPDMEFPPDQISSRAKPAPPARTASTIQAERMLLLKARSYRKDGNPAGALTLLDEYSRTFTGGKLLEEQAALRVLVLCDLGHTKRAKRQAAAFRSRWPASVQANRVNGSCAGSAAE